MSRIYIIANFCCPFDGKRNGRFLYLAEMIAKEGVQVELITSDFSYSTKKYKSPFRQEAYKAQIIYCHESGYVKYVGLRRLWSHYVCGRIGVWNNRPDKEIKKDNF